MAEQWWTADVDRARLYEALTAEIFIQFEPHIAAGDEEGGRAWQLATAIRVALHLEAPQDR